MNAESLRYLSENTSITYLSEGSIARGLMEATNLEIARVQEYIASTYSNVFINTAQGIYLDLIGEMLGVTRVPKTAANSAAEDNNVQLSVVSGTLGEKFPSPNNANQGVIPAGLTIQATDGSITFKTSQAVTFNATLTEIFVPVVADSSGTASNVGRGRLTIHDGPAGVNVTNLKTIANGAEIESDKEYRFRLANTVAGNPTSNETSIRLAVAGLPDVSRIEFNEFARGAGTFDVLLVPVGNIVSRRVADIARRAIENVSAFGVSSRVVEPVFKRFRISVQLIPLVGTGAGILDVNRVDTKNAVLDYFETLPLGGELIINRLRASIIEAVTQDIKDIKIIDLCINGRPRAIRNVKLLPNELFTPDVENGPAVQVI
jgi:uncharacterized phage protein gp47/JayE